MTDIPQNLDFHERLRRLEAQNRAATAAESPGFARRLSLIFLRLVAVMPVWLVLLKGLIMAHMGVADYAARLSALAINGNIPQGALALLRPDPFSLVVTQVLGRVVGA
jgi:hypothetical protein